LEGDLNPELALTGRFGSDKRKKHQHQNNVNHNHKNHKKVQASFSFRVGVCSSGTLLLLLLLPQLLASSTAARLVPPRIAYENKMEHEVKRQRRDSTLSTLDGGVFPVVEWQGLPEELIPSILAHYDVRTLIEKKQVSRNWRQLCTSVIHAKRTTSSTGKVFETNRELRDAVQRYCDDDACTPDAAEEIAQTYGWLIGQWDVSNLQDFSYIFYLKRMFNEDISAWNVSNATSMHCMFFGAINFNQNLSVWNTSQVTTMYGMFNRAVAFNGDIGAWDTSQVTTMARMFSGAWSFNQPIGAAWDISRVTTMNGMFSDAESFNQDMSSWGSRRSSATTTVGMFFRATAFNEALGRRSFNYRRDRPTVFSTKKSMHGIPPSAS
jgi:surface protein